MEEKDKNIKHNHVLGANKDFGSLIKENFPKSSENIFKGFISQSSEGISLINQEGVIVDCNESMLKIYEVDKKDIIGKSIWDFEKQFYIQQKQKKEFLDKVYQIQKDYLENINNKKPETHETEIETKTKIKHISLLFFPIITENACFVGRIIHDITEKKEKEIELKNYRNSLEELVQERTGELKQSEEKFRLLFEKSHDPILIIDEFKFVECNEATVKILGFKSKEEIYKVHPSEISPEYQPDGRLSYEKAQEQMELTYKNGFIRFEWVHIDKKGHEIVMDISLTKIPYRGRQMIFTIWRILPNKNNTKSR